MHTARVLLALVVVPGLAAARQSPNAVFPPCCKCLRPSAFAAMPSLRATLTAHLPARHPSRSALHPGMRADWAASWARLLRPGATLACLAFPIDPERGTGPPWPVTPQQYKDLLLPAGTRLAPRLVLALPPGRASAECGRQSGSAVAPLKPRVRHRPWGFSQHSCVLKLWTWIPGVSFGARIHAHGALADAYLSLVTLYRGRALDPKFDPCLPLFQCRLRPGARGAGAC